MFLQTKLLYLCTVLHLITKISLDEMIKAISTKYGLKVLIEGGECIKDLSSLTGLVWWGEYDVERPKTPQWPKQRHPKCSKEHMFNAFFPILYCLFLNDTSDILVQRVGIKLKLKMTVGNALLKENYVKIITLTINNKRSSFFPLFCSFLKWYN